jgi:hypothetical protein
VRFWYEISSGRYRSTTGLIRESAIRAGLDAVVDAQAASMRDLTSSLIDGRLALSAWQVQMMQSIKLVHLVGLTLGNGGWASLDQSHFGWVGQRIRTQYRYLQKFAQDIASGKQPLSPQAVARAALYARAARATHRAAQRRQAEARGMDQERNQLGVADHCNGCLEQTAAGWVPIGMLVPVGSRDCLANCHCSLLFRRTPGVAVPAVPFQPPMMRATPLETEAERLHASATTSVVTSVQRTPLGVLAAGAQMAVSNKPWSSFSASDYTPEQYKRACLIVLGDGATKDQCKLPVREPDGTLNVNAVHAAAAVLAGSRGGVQAPPADKKKAARALIRLYGQINDEPPDSLKRLAA